MFKVDTHLHLDLYKNQDTIINYINTEKSYTIAVTNLPDLYEQYAKDGRNSQYVRYALGFHPELACRYFHQLSIFDRNLSSTRYVGEVGLDFTTKDVRDRIAQEQVFRHILRACNRARGKILTIHSRKAEKRVLELLKDVHSCQVILHWYTGPLSLIDVAIGRGYYFSINHQMINSIHGRKVIQNIPIEKILIESDAPFTKGLRKNYCVSFMKDIYRYICYERNMSEKNIEIRLKENFRRILSGELSS
ncbi:Qat anti-phage system TatD family nuclease QatD [Mitsuokella multacida]|uniref:Qat anti-phage system TatD family nuclease QatD n=1 Tax=Mitsuokella multacida TaxID=52226 RepID=UPI0022E96FB3|nr:Qat anti-phage system TatD family nuclease QatD [Mitsuokella multacida]